MGSYKPLSTTITAATISGYNGAKLSRDIGMTYWNLVLLNGTAMGVSLHQTDGSIVSQTISLPSGTVLGWYSLNAGSIGDADIQTFADSTARYAVTINTGAPITLRFYQHG